MREAPGMRAGQASLVRDLLREYLLRSGPRRGQRLPYEHALTKELGCSRNVLREALALLAADGLIHRERGRGTHVVTTSPAISIDQGIDLRTAMREEVMPPDPGRAVSYRVLRADTVRAPALLAALLGVPSGTVVSHVERLVEVDGRRVGHWDVHIVGVPGAPGVPPGESGARVGALARTQMAERLLRSLGHHPDHEEVRVEAITPSPRTAGLLYCGERHRPTLRMSRRFYDAGDRVLALFIGRCALPGAAFSVVRQCAPDEEVADRR